MKTGKKRCFGGPQDDTPYALYHDHEWGIPAHNDTHLFEMLLLEGAQAGLSWETVLKKRTCYRKAFHNFEPSLVANMTDEELESLLDNPGIIRNRRKIYAARQNASVFLTIQKEYESFDCYVWGFVHNTPILNSWKSFEEVPAQTAESKALSEDLKRRKMSFVGPTIMYAFMQAIGMVDDHLIDCWRRT